jgi:hypothetical protein
MGASPHDALFKAVFAQPGHAMRALRMILPPTSATTRSRTMKDDLEQLLKSLHLRKIAELFDEEAKRAEKADSSYQEFVARLLRAQWQANQEAALAWRIRRAGLPEQWTLESFPFKRQPGVNQRQIRTFAELEFVPKAENIVFIGPTGVGKTGWPRRSCSRRCRTATAACLCAPRTCSTRCTPPSPTARPAACSTDWPRSTSWSLTHVEHPVMWRTG